MEEPVVVRSQTFRAHLFLPKSFRPTPLCGVPDAAVLVRADRMDVVPREMLCQECLAVIEKQPRTQ